MTNEERDGILLDLKKGQEELFKGQSERDEILLNLKKGQENLFKGQLERDEILLDLKKGQENLFKGQSERDEILLDLKKGQEELLERVENLENGQKETNSELRKVSQSVARIEHEHGEKLQILFDVVTSHSKKFDSIDQRLEKIENKLDKHSDQIYYLNSKVQAF